METRPISSLKELDEYIGMQKRSFLLLFKKDSTQSEIAYENFVSAGSEVTDIGVFTADVESVKDIHPVYSVTTVPTVLEFQENNLKNVYRGAHDPGYFKAIFDNAVYKARAEKAGKPVKNVVIYTTPTCSWCNTLKSYLRKNQIRFSEIDISRDESAAREMVNKSGQQGVPQTSVNGSMVIGFDKTKLNRLLEISE
jgi:glutaredoxin-like YruB-family protein